MEYEKPLLEEEEDNIKKYLFPFDSKEINDLKEVIKNFPETIIDFHSHAGPEEAVIAEENKIPETYGDTFTYREIGATFLHRAILSGILTRQNLHKVYQVVMAFPFRETNVKKANEWLLKETEGGGGFLPFLILPPGNSLLEQTKKNLEAGSYFGIGEMHPEFVSPRAENIRGEKGYLSEESLELANKQCLPITIHLPTHLLNHIEEVKKFSIDYPKLKIVLAHMGLAQVLTPRSKEALKEAVNLPNVYFDTSTVTDKEVFAYVLKEAGAEKILFASDAPFDALKLEVRFMEGKMKIFSSQDLSGTEKTQEEMKRMLISSPEALIEAIEEVYPEKNQTKLAREKIFYQNALKILPRKLPPFREEWMYMENGIMTKHEI